MRENKPRLIPFLLSLLVFFGGATTSEKKGRKSKKVIAIVHQSKCTCNYERHEKLRLTVKWTLIIFLPVFFPLPLSQSTNCFYRDKLIEIQLNPHKNDYLLDGLQSTCATIFAALCKFRLLALHTKQNNMIGTWDNGQNFNWLLCNWRQCSCGVIFASKPYVLCQCGRCYKPSIMNNACICKKKCNFQYS